MKKGAEIILLCGDDDCDCGCPIVKYDGKMISIKDDFKGEARLSIESWNTLIENVEKRIFKKIKNR